MFASVGNRSSQYIKRIHSQPIILLHNNTSWSLKRLTTQKTSITRSFSTTKASKMSSSSSPSSDIIKFHTFDVTKQVFLQRKHTIGIVNLMPIAPLHVLIIPRKPFHRLTDLPKDHLKELFDIVQDTSSVVQKLTNSPACTIAIQDGKEAGQSVPHLHVHVIPRKDGDFTPKDIIYEHLEEFGLQLYKRMSEKNDQTIKKKGLGPDPDQERIPRSEKEMEIEAQWIKDHFSNNSNSNTM